MSGHTAGPLVVGAHFAERHGGRTYIPILRPGNDPVPIAVVHRDVDGYGRDEGEATAAFIVTAYNSHADLVKALEEIAKWADLKDAEYPETASGEEVEYGYGRSHGLRIAGKSARAALATLTARKMG